ncbi:hypothetical protein [Streptomyces sp. NPDC005148]
MDLQGVGALAAAGVAAIGIPCALVAGRWQMRGALAQAQETARAGLAQAESSYNAALDAVRAQAQTAHTQWTRGVQREAFVAFIVATDRVWHACGNMTFKHKLSDGSLDLGPDMQELSSARQALANAYAIITLEAPESLVGLAYYANNQILMIATCATHEVEIRAAFAKLKRLCAENVGDGPLEEARDAILRLSDVVRASGITGDPRQALQSDEMPWADAVLPEPMAEAEAEARTALCRPAISAAFTSGERDFLLDWAFNGTEQAEIIFRQFDSSYQDGMKDFTAQAREILGHATELDPAD